MTWAGSYRATPAVQDFASASTYAVNKATGTVAGDLILLYCASANTGPFSCPGFAAYTGAWAGELLARTADGTEGSTFTVTNTAGAYPAEIIQATIAGPASIDVVGASVLGHLTANPSATGLTVAGSNELLLWFGAAEVDSTGAGASVATAVPSGFTSRVTGTPGTVGRSGTLLCDNTAVATGATGSIAATNASTLNDWTTQMVAIKPVAYAGPVYRATPAVQNFTAATTYTVNKATGTVAGDLVLLFCSSEAGTVFSCTGFAASVISGGGVIDQLLYRTADGTEGSTFTVASSNSVDAAIVQATVVGPCSIDVIGVSAGGATSTNPTATGLTVAGSNELLLWFGAAENSAFTAGASVATTIPSGFTSRVTGTAGSSYPDVLLCDNTAIASGATGSIASTNATSNYWNAKMVAIQPLARPQYRATPAVQNFTSTANTFAVTAAAGIVAGDVILLYCATNTWATTFSCPGFNANTASSTISGTLLTRTADGTEGSTFTVTSSVGGAHPVVLAVTQAVIAGPCSIDVVGASNGSGNSTPSANPSATGLTVAGSNELLMWFGAAVTSTGTGTPVATTIPSGFTSRATGTSGTASLPDMLLCDNTAVAAGATGSVASVNATSDYWAAQMVAVKQLPPLVVVAGLLAFC